MGLDKQQTVARELLEDSIDHVGSRTQLAAEMRVSEQTVREWYTRGRVPATPARLLAMLLRSWDTSFGDEGDLERALRG